MRRFALCLLTIGWVMGVPFGNSIFSDTRILAAHERSAGRMQPDIVCLDPGIEFPVDCDEDDD